MVTGAACSAGPGGAACPAVRSPDGWLDGTVRARTLRRAERAAGTASTAAARAAARQRDTTTRGRTRACYMEGENSTVSCNIVECGVHRMDRTCSTRWQPP